MLLPTPLVVALLTAAVQGSITMPPAASEGMWARRMLQQQQQPVAAAPGDSPRMGPGRFHHHQFGFPAGPGKCCARCPPGSVDCLANCVRSCGNLDECVSAGDGAYAAACQIGCFRAAGLSSGSKDPAAEVGGQFEPTTECESLCVKRATELCNANRGCSKDFGCTVDDCVTEARSKCDTSKFREIIAIKNAHMDNFASGMRAVYRNVMPQMGNEMMQDPVMFEPMGFAEEQLQHTMGIHSPMMMASGVPSFVPPPPPHVHPPMAMHSEMRRRLMDDVERMRIQMMEEAGRMHNDFMMMNMGMEMGGFPRVAPGMH